MLVTLVKPVVVAVKDQPCVLRTLPAGALVEFDPGAAGVEVRWDGKIYAAMLADVLDAGYPVEWIGA